MMAHRSESATILLLALFFPAPGAASASEPEAVGRTLSQDCVIDASCPDVWRALTSAEGIVRAWGVAAAKIDLRVGGTIRTVYAPGQDVDLPNAIMNTILSYEPERMLSFRATAPANAPRFVQLACTTCWSVLRLEPLGPGRTRVTVTGLGYGVGADWDRAYRFFEMGNAATLKHMQAALGTRPGASTESPAPRVLALLGSLAGGEWTAGRERAGGASTTSRMRWEARLGGEYLEADTRIDGSSEAEGQGLLVVGYDPLAGGAGFWHFGGGGAIARGAVRLLADELVALDWTVDAPGGVRQERYVEIRIEGPTAYRLRTWGSPAAKSSGEEPMLDLEYRRAGAVPERPRPAG